MNKSALLFPASLLAIQAGLVQVHAAQVDYFLKLDGITGESTDSNHKGWIQLESFSWGASNPTTIGSATGGAGAGKVKFSDISVGKVVDKSSPDLVAFCASGKHIDRALLEVVTHQLKIDYKERTETVFLRLTLSDVLVTGVSEAGLKLDTPTEALSLNFTKIAVSYQPQTKNTDTTLSGNTTGLIDTETDGN